MHSTVHKLILLFAFLLLLKPLFSFSTEQFHADPYYQKSNYTDDSQLVSFTRHSNNSVWYENKGRIIKGAPISPASVGSTGSQDLKSSRNKGVVSLALIGADKLVNVNVGSPIVFNKILTPECGSVSQYNASTIQLNSPGHYSVTWGFGLKSRVNNPFIQMALQTSSSPDEGYATYNKFAILVNSSSSVVSMTVGVEIAKPTYMRVTNISKIPAVLGLGIGDSILANCPMAYIDVVQID